MIWRVAGDRDLLLSGRAGLWRLCGGSVAVLWGVLVALWQSPLWFCKCEGSCVSGRYWSVDPLGRPDHTVGCSGSRPGSHHQRLSTRPVPCEVQRLAAGVGTRPTCLVTTFSSQASQSLQRSSLFHPCLSGIAQALCDLMVQRASLFHPCSSDIAQALCGLMVQRSALFHPCLSGMAQVLCGLMVDFEMHGSPSPMELTDEHLELPSPDLKTRDRCVAPPSPPPHLDRRACARHLRSRADAPQQAEHRHSLQAALEARPASRSWAQSGPCAPGWSDVTGGCLGWRRASWQRSTPFRTAGRAQPSACSPHMMKYEYHTMSLPHRVQCHAGHLSSSACTVSWRHRCEGTAASRSLASRDIVCSSHHTSFHVQTSQ